LLDFALGGYFHAAPTFHPVLLSLAMLISNTDLQLGMNVRDRQQIFTSPHPDP
jgi:hypothetical protein